jgi:type IV secretory pathway VirB6-like protein
MLQELFQNVDSFGTNFVAQSYQALAATLTGQAGGVDYLSLLLTLYLIFWGVSIWWGSAKGSVTDQVYRLFRVFVIYTLATSWADFQSLVYHFGMFGNEFGRSGNSVELKNADSFLLLACQKDIARLRGTTQGSTPTAKNIHRALRKRRSTVR